MIADNLNYVSWAMGFAALVLQELGVTRDFRKVARTTLVAGLLFSSLLIKGHIGWLLIVLAETALLIGQDLRGKHWGLVFTSLIPGALIFYFEKSGAHSFVATSIWVLVYLFFRCVDWPFLGIGQFQKEESKERYWGVVWCTAVTLLLVPELQKDILIPGLLVFSLLNIVCGNIGGMAVLLWLALSLLQPSLSVFGVLLFLSIRLSFWWKFIGLVLFSSAWVLVEWQIMDKWESVNLFLFSTIAGYGVMLVQWEELKSSWISFVGVAACAVFLLSQGLFNGLVLVRDPLQALPLLGAILFAILGGFICKKGYQVCFSGKNPLEKMNSFLTNTTISPKEVFIEKETVTNEGGAERPVLGEVGQFVLWSVVFLLIAVIGQCLV